MQRRATAALVKMGGARTDLVALVSWCCTLARRKVIRPMYSSPPIHGALIVAEVLSDPKLRAMYVSE